MLSSLHIKNLPLLRQLALDFYPGLSVLSGETGAGKSLMIAALGLALGDRPRGLDSQGEQIQISAGFSLDPTSRARHWLAEQGLEEGDQCLIRRQLSDKRSKAFINGTQVGMGEAQQLGDMLVNLHSQHQHHALLERTYQRQLLDKLAGCNQLCTRLADLYHQYNQLRKASDDAATHKQLHQRELELVQYNLGELDALAPASGEYPQLDEEHKFASQAQQLQDLVAMLMALLEGQDQQPGMQKHLQRLAGQLVGCGLEATANLARLLEEASALLDEALSEAHHLPQQLDEQRYAQLEERLSGYHQLARKHQVRPEQLPELHQQLREQAEQLAGQLANPQQAKAQLEHLHSQLNDLGEQLSQARAAGGQQLCDRVNQLLPQLAMPSARLSLALERLHSIGSEGWEQPQLLLQTNPGGLTLPLKQIASGGELSRVSLAIYLACTTNAEPMTMVFDEVDVGLSGAVAETLGRILKELSHHHQVLCISHQPQVVAVADYHYNLTKHAGRDDASIEVRRLEAAETIGEIARMLAGSTRASHQLAEEMYSRGRN